MSPTEASKIVIAAGTYDGVLAGWEIKGNDDKLKLTFASGVHTGSIRSLSMATSPNGDEPGSLLSCGYDETLQTHDWHKRLTSSGEIRTPNDFGTPVCSSFAPPQGHSTHCLVGFTNGKLCIYKKRDWSVQHVLAGHDGGVASIAVHPTGKLALSGGVSDGKIKLWDLTKGRLAFVNKVNPSSLKGGRTSYDPVASLEWSKDGEFYAVAYGSHITVREVASGKDLLDVDLPSRVHQVTLMAGEEGVFVAAACNDGSLPVLMVEDSGEEDRRAIMAIEPVDSHLAGEQRFKCIRSVRGFDVVTATSAGVVSLMSLAGAVKMMTSGGDDEDVDSDADSEENSEENSDEGDMELAVEILQTVRLGTGARITCLTAWGREESDDEEDSSPEKPEEIDPVPPEKDETPPQEEQRSLKRKQNVDVEMDETAIRKARSLVKKAKTIKEKRDKKKRKKKAA